MAESRQRILEQLQRHGPMSVRELSRVLGLTSVTIRHHLEAMLQDELVDAPSQRRRPGPGRPELTYSLSPLGREALPRNLGELCQCVLEACAREMPASSLEALLRQAGRRLGERERLGPGADLEARLHQVTGFLEARGYFPEVLREGPRLCLALAHCPYQDIARHSPLVCAFDQALLEAMLESEAEFEARIVDQDPRCVLALPPTPAVKAESEAV
ncbi:MAG: ArsR family transcriptional regulator [Chloroflexota bacterium]